MKARTTITYPGMVALRTAYLGPTNTRGSRIRVEVENGGSTPRDRLRTVYPYDHALSSEGNHASAAEAFVNERKSLGHWHEDIRLMQGSTADGYVFIPYFPDEETAM